MQSGASHCSRNASSPPAAVAPCVSRCGASSCAVAHANSRASKPLETARAADLGGLPQQPRPLRVARGEAHDLGAATTALAAAAGGSHVVLQLGHPQLARADGRVEEALEGGDAHGAVGAPRVSVGGRMRHLSDAAQVERRRRHRLDQVEGREGGQHAGALLRREARPRRDEVRHHRERRVGLWRDARAERRHEALEVARRALGAELDVGRDERGRERARDRRLHAVELERAGQQPLRRQLGPRPRQRADQPGVVERLVGLREEAALDQLAHQLLRVAVEVDVALQQRERLLLGPAEPARPRGCQPLLLVWPGVAPHGLEALEHLAGERRTSGRLPVLDEAHAELRLDLVLQPLPEAERQLKVGHGERRDARPVLWAAQGLAVQHLQRQLGVAHPEAGSAQLFEGCGETEATVVDDDHQGALGQSLKDRGRRGQAGVEVGARAGLNVVDVLTSGAPAAEGGRWGLTHERYRLSWVAVSRKCVGVQLRLRRGTKRGQ